MTTGSITSLGIGSSLDLQGMLDTQREADEAIVGLKVDEVEAQTSVKEQLNSVLSQLLSMKTSSLSLSLSSNYLYRSVTVSDTDVVTATAKDGTDTGSHQVETSRLATASIYMSEGASSETACVYVPTVQESTTGFEDTDIVLAEGEILDIEYGPGDDPEVFTITGAPGGMTAEELVAAINSDTANQGDDGNALVTASTYADDDGTTHMRVEAASGATGEDNRIRVSGSIPSLGFAAPVSELSYTTGDGDVYTISIPSETTLEGLAGRINDDDDNPGVTATIIDTGTGDNPYKLVLEADDSGEDNRITIISEPPDLVLTEKNGSGYSMTGDPVVSFDAAVTIDTTNNTIVFQEDAGDGYGDMLTAEIEQGDYETAEELAQAVESALENESGLNGNAKDYQVDIDRNTGRMTIAEAGTLEGLNIHWGDGGSTASAILGFSETQKITPAASSLNAEVTVDKISYQRQDNLSLTGIIGGVTLSLYSTGTTTVSVSASTGTVEDAITSMVETYNSLIAEIDENDDYDEDTETWGTLAQSSTARSLEQGLKSLFSTTVNTGGSITSLMDMGIEFDEDGTLTLDADTLSQQLLENFEEVQDLLLGFDTETGLAEILNDAIGEYALSDGYIDGEIDMIDERISRLEEDYAQQMERLDKKYETMATEYAALDSYLSELTSMQSYIESMMSDVDDE